MKNPVPTMANRINIQYIKLLIMKKEAFLIVLFFSFFGSYAQSYIPFPEKDAEWVSRILYEDPQSKGGDYCLLQ